MSKLLLTITLTLTILIVFSRYVKYSDTVMELRRRPGMDEKDLKGSGHTCERDEAPMVLRDNYHACTTQKDTAAEIF